MARPFIVISKVPVAVATFYYMITFAWVVGINTTLSIFLTPLYDFGPRQIGKSTSCHSPLTSPTTIALSVQSLTNHPPGFFYFTPIVAAILGETVGHWLHDFLAHWYMGRHAGRLEPEARLAVVWLSTPFMIAGLILLGFALENGLHFMITSLGWGLYVFGIMITTVGLNAYVLDSYPEVCEARFCISLCLPVSRYVALHALLFLNPAKKLVGS
jgi:hypothetical protein